MDENYCALYIAIIKECNVEDAFRLYHYGHKKVVYNKNGEEIENMIKLKNQGYTYQQIGDIYGIARNTVCEKIKRYKNKIECAV